MLTYSLAQNNFLHQGIKGYSDCVYAGRGLIDSSSFAERVTGAIYILKNQFKSEPIEKLVRAKNYLKAIMVTDIRKIILENNLTNVVIVCTPRSKADFQDAQLYFHKAVSEAANSLNVMNGAYYIKRIRNTKTTHLLNTKNGDMSGEGDLPYPGITDNTCQLLGNVRGKNVILVDDIYTRNVNIDEDCCQFLLNNGANTVILYTICKTGLSI